MHPSERTFAIEQATLAVPQRLPQRQDSTEAQLCTLLEMANRAGCYDAADWLKARLEKR